MLAAWHNSAIGKTVTAIGQAIDKARTVPPENWSAGEPLKKMNGGVVDKFDNLWTKGPSRTAGEAFEWDVQLSKTGKNQLGWLSRDGSHLNVSLEGRITHK